MTPNEEAPEQWMINGAEKHARKTLPNKADYEDYSQGVKANFIAGIKFGLKHARAQELEAALRKARDALKDAHAGFVILSTMTAVVDGPLKTKEELDCAYDEAEDREVKVAMAIDELNALLGEQEEEKE